MTNSLTTRAKIVLALAATSALTGVIAFHAHYHYQRGYKACTVEREADTLAAQDVGRALTESAQTLFNWLTVESDDVGGELAQREAEAAARTTQSEQEAQQWRLRYERLQRDAATCSDALLDPAYGMLNDEARAGALGRSGPDPD